MFPSDRGANIKLALKDFFRLNCFVHFINYIVKASCCIDIVKTQITECKSLVKYFKLRGVNNLLKTSLKQALDIRFNSVCTMFLSIIANKNYVKSIIERANEEHRMENIQFSKILAFVTYLEEFERWSVMTSASKKPTLYLVKLGIDCLKKHSQRKNDDIDIVSLMKTKAQLYIEEKFHAYHRIATFLHPNFKGLKFASDSMRVQTHNDIKDSLDKFKSQVTPRLTRKSSTNSDSSTSDDVEEDELTAYTSYVWTADANIDLIKWWQERESIFPVLSKFAVFIHSIPASSIPSEKKFSDAGNVITNKRTSLRPDFIEGILMLRSVSTGDKGW